jgi:hypothetical protein
VVADELITKLVPATIDPTGTESTPGVPPIVLCTANMIDEASTAVVETVTVPDTMFAEVPMEALDPGLIISLLPIVPRVKLPLVVARKVVAVTEPGATTVEGKETTTAPVVGEAATWLAVPVTEVTVPAPDPPSCVQTALTIPPNDVKDVRVKVSFKISLTHL